MRQEELLETLHDFRKHCPGVVGSMVADRKGKTREVELPAFADVDAGLITNQLADIYLLLEPMLKKPAKMRQSASFDAILRYDTISIICRPFSPGLLVVIAEQDANVVRVRALMNLLVKKLTSVLGRGVR